MTAELTIDEINKLSEKGANVIKFEEQGDSVGLNMNGFPVQLHDNTFVKGDQVAVNSNHEQFIRVREVMISSPFSNKYSAYYLSLADAYEFQIIKEDIPDRIQFVIESNQLKRSCKKKEDYFKLIEFLITESYRAWEFNLDMALNEIEQLYPNILEEYVDKETSSPNRLIVSRILDEYDVNQKSNGNV